MGRKNFHRKTQDVGNIVFLEHVNLTVPDQETATTFYVEGLGFTRDPYMMVGTDNMWINVGQQQFHLPKGPPQHFRGHIGIVVPDLAALAERLQRVQDKLASTQFAYQVKKGLTTITGPWGNRFQAYEAGNGFQHSRGIPYVEMLVTVGTVPGIKAFYQQCMRAPCEVKKDSHGKAAARVCAGPGQQLVFRETTAPLPPYDGHHIAIYVADFSGPYTMLKKQRLISQEDNPFQYRFQEIVPPGTKQSIYTIEHEVRSLYHPLYKQPLINRTGNEHLP
jgi:catechol 2,3-dioxygenase-like lactoylglutathione lyase family enzyme